MSESISFTVFGTPAPQGSGKAFVHNTKDGRTIAKVTHDSKKTMPYRQNVAQMCALAVRDLSTVLTPDAVVPLPAPRGVPVALRIVFYLAKPASARKRDLWPVKRPDLDKLVRACGDALAGGMAYEDDSQVCDLIVSKRFGLPERTEVTITVIEEEHGTGKGERG